MKNFTVHSDPNHGWIEVHPDDLAAVGMTRRDFSSYSYQNGEVTYLEEDCDATKFLAAWAEKYGHDFGFSENTSNGDSWIRGLPRLN